MVRPLRVAALALLAAAPALAQEHYVVGIDDVLQVVVLGQADLTGAFVVDRQGEITFPILGQIRVSGLSPEDLEGHLTTLLAAGYLKHPQVSVSVKEYRSQRVFVTGEVQKPGTYALKGDRSLRALLGDVGAFTADAGHEIVVIRPPREPGSSPRAAGADPAGSPEGVPGAEVFRVALQDLQEKPERNLLLEAGDSVYVPRAAQIFISGHVARQGPYRYQEGMTVLQALTLAGGITDRGSSKRIKVVRVVDGHKHEAKVKLSDVVQPGDTIVVPERFF